METPEKEIAPLDQIEASLNQLTRKQRKIYEAHLELFEAIFEYPTLKNVEPDLLEIIETEQKEYLINQLLSCNTTEYKYMTIKGVRADVKRTIQNNLDELVAVVLDIAKDLENTKS